MSDIQVTQGFAYDMRKLINSIIGGKFFADYAIVTSINADETVNVTHAVNGELLDGTPLPPTVTNNVEVLYPTSTNFGMRWDISVGDRVLLIGLQNTMSVTDSIPNLPSDFLHYVQSTMKAIPLGISQTPPLVQINVDAGKLQIKNAAQSLYTVMNNLREALNTFSGATAQASITSGGASSVSLAAAIVALMATLNASIVTNQTALAALLEA